jgi:hypothetical protein
MREQLTALRTEVSEHNERTALAVGMLIVSCGGQLDSRVGVGGGRIFSSPAARTAARGLE